MEVIIAGGRNHLITYANRVQLDRLREDWDITSIVHGGARGIDTQAGEWAQLSNLPVQAFPADWKRYGLSAGPLRNEEMARHVGRHGGLIAFPGGKGTADMLRTARKHGLLIYEF